MKEPLLIRIPTELKEWLDVTATRRGLSRTALILQILWAYHDDAEQSTSHSS